MAGLGMEEYLKLLAQRQVTWDDGAAENFRTVITSPVFLDAIASLMLGMTKHQQMIIQTDFANQQSLFQAAEARGIYRGFLMTVEAFLELTHTSKDLEDGRTEPDSDTNA